MFEAASILQSLAPVDLRNPVNRHHSLNIGRAAWWLALPGWVGGTNFYDLMGLFPGTLTGMTSQATQGWHVAVRAGGKSCLEFDRNCYVLVSSSTSALPITGPFTLAAWVATTAQGGAVISHIRNSVSFAGYEYAIGQGSSTVNPGKPSFWNGSAWQSAASVVNDGVWHRIVVTNNGSSSFFYLDGRLDNSLGQSTPSAPAGSLYIGTRDAFLSNTNVSFSGSMDDVSLWNRALSASEIREDYDLSRRGYPDVLNRVPVWSYAAVAAASRRLLSLRRKAAARAA